MATRTGTAGWTIPKHHAARFAEAGSHLERYATRLTAVEINSSFYRAHSHKTYARWAASVPEDFRFAVKVPKAATHVAKLSRCGAVLQAFVQECSGLGEKLGPLLVQLPPSLAFDAAVAEEFFATLREVHAGAVVVEPRHVSWFTSTVSRVLRDFEVARVAADPPKGSPLAAEPGGWERLRYFRLHGSPRTYYSDYDGDALDALVSKLDAARAGDTFVIFDNTALGHATANALEVQQRLGLNGA